eukprot:COSAG01_NODE_11743_length_1868_cov_8.443754_1_plen_27_part_10
MKGEADDVGSWPNGLDHREYLGSSERR